MQVLPGAEPMGVRVRALLPLGKQTPSIASDTVLMVGGSVLPPPGLNRLEVSGFQPQGGKDLNTISCHMLPAG